jgi:dGTPase
MTAAPSGTQVRRIPEATFDTVESDFRIDLERIRFSPYFSRLSAVTQVIPQAGSGTVIHNRLTHSLKVTAVARSIAVSLRDGADEQTRRTIAELGGCDHIVAQSAAAAHDLGHPPFGHLGEQVLDRIARTRLGLADGFEGNAQTFRILTTLDNCDATARGLNLTTAVRAAVLKYPWTRHEWRDVEAPAPQLPRGVGVERADGALKYSSYLVNEAEMAEVKARYPNIGQHQQTVECSVMDVADDIAYSVHDLDDFYRAGVLQYTTVAAELENWLAHQQSLASLDTVTLESSLRTPGHSLEQAWRHTYEKDQWIADEDAFREAVLRVQEGLVEGLLAIPFDGGVAAERRVAAFTRYWIDRLKASIAVEADPNVRSGHVRLTQDAWHDVVVLKFVHTRFVLDRPDLTIYQRGQGRVLETLVEGFHSWLGDPDDAVRAPRRLIDSVESTTQSYVELKASGLRQVEHWTDADIVRFGRARAVIDYIASFTDAQAMTAAALLGGTSDRHWNDGRSL